MGLASTTWTLGSRQGVHVLEAGTQSEAHITVEAEGLGEPASEFQFDLLLDSTLTSEERAWFRSAVARWERVLLDSPGAIRVPVADSSFNCFVVTIADEHVVEDVELQVTKHTGDDFLYRVDHCLVRSAGGVPLVTGISFNFPELLFWVHPDEVSDYMAQVVGIAIGHYTWGFHRQELVGNPSAEWLDGVPGADSHFTGELARTAFERVGGASYTGSKVPLHNEGAYGSDALWRHSVFGDELMPRYHDRGDKRPLSRVTVQAFADLGFKVNVAAADPYTLPEPSAMAALATIRRPTQTGRIPGPVYFIAADGTLLRTPR